MSGFDLVLFPMEIAASGSPVFFGDRFWLELKAPWSTTMTAGRLTAPERGQLLKSFHLAIAALVDGTFKRPFPRLFS
jgi:hypothetical protein